MQPKVPSEKDNRLSPSDQKIIDALKKDSKAYTAKEIAQIAKMSASTVAKRLCKLREKEIVKTTVHLGASLEYRALISIDLDLSNIKSSEPKYEDQTELLRFIKSGLPNWPKYRSIMEKVHIDDVHSLLGGRADICVVVSSSDVSAMYNFVTKVLHELRGVRNTNTAVIVATQ